MSELIKDRPLAYGFIEDGNLHSLIKWPFMEEVSVFQPVGKSLVDFIRFDRDFMRSVFEILLLRYMQAKEHKNDYNFIAAVLWEVAMQHRLIGTNNYLSILRRLFKLYNVDPTELVFYLRDETDETDSVDVGEKQALRKRYWAYALDAIHEIHTENGSFSNVNPSVQSWISGYFGISGFSITCTTSTSFAGVEIYLGNANKDRNKESFDYLFGFKNEIEAKLDTSLIWSRGEDTKSSKVHIRLHDVNIENEEDWARMAKFHSEWSKKLYDVIVPYLRAKYLN